MPYVLKNQDETTDQTGQPKNVSGVSTSFNVNIPGQTAKPGNQQSSGQFQNLQSYLNANQSQGNEMASKVGANVEDSVSGAKTAQSGVTSKVSGINSYDPTKAIAKVSSLTPDEQSEYKTVKKTGGYTGPSAVADIEGYGDAQKKIDDATSRVGLSQTEEGQKQLLTDVYKKPTYTAGSKNLDQAILGNSTQGKEAIGQIGSKYKDLSDYFAGQYGGAQTTIDNNLKTAKANREAFIPAETSTMDSYMRTLADRAKTANDTNSALRTRVSNDITDDVLSQETLRELGLTPNTQLYNLNLGNYLSTNETPMNENTVATADERKQYRLLQDLFDGGGNAITETNPLEGYDPLSFDINRFNSDQQAADKAFNDWANSAQYSNPYNYSDSYSNWFSGALGLPQGQVNGGGIDTITPTQYINETSPEIPYYSDNQNAAQHAARRAANEQIKKDLEQWGYDRYLREG